MSDTIYKERVRVQDVSGTNEMRKRGEGLNVHVRADVDSLCYVYLVVGLTDCERLLPH